MAFFSFSLLEDSFTYLSSQIDPNQKYYSKDIALWKELNNRNKKKRFCEISQQNRVNNTNIGKKLLLCLPPRFGLGDAIEYSIATKSIIKSGKFDKVGIAFCSNHLIIFKDIFKFTNIHPLLISEKEVKSYDTLFHITLEIRALKFQKYKRSNIAQEICRHFRVPLCDFKFKQKQNTPSNKKTISIFPVSTSVIRSLPFNVIEEIVNKLKDEFQIKIIIDNSSFSKHLQEKNKNHNFIFVQPNNLESLITEINKINFGIFVDSGPLHLAKAFDKKGILIETSVSSKILLHNTKNIYSVKNNYKSNYCQGPCGLVDLFEYNNKVGCYETNKLYFENIKTLKSLKKLQRWNKKDINSHFIMNPVGCVKEIDVKNIIELIKVKIKEC